MKLKHFLLAVLVLLIGLGSFLAWDVYQRIFAPNVELSESSREFHIHTGWAYDDVVKALKQEGFVKDTTSFKWVAKQKKYPALVKPGRYVLLDGMNNNQLVNLLRSGEQDPVRVVIRSVRTKPELAGLVARYLEPDSAELLDALNAPALASHYGFSTETFLTMFIPNTYEFYWNTTVDEFIIRMAREYKRFWTDERIAKAQQMGLSQSEVSILASIVQAEQGAHADERPMVAGLYLNRIKRGMRLESDPTLIHAIGDFSIKRVLAVHKDIESPYNTYRNTGLPPGPILLPEITSIDAVLNPEEHRYIYMCAKEDFSGYHNFARSYSEHLKNARKYRRELDRRKIYR